MSVIELPDKVFRKLRKIAEKDGVTPEVWIETVLDEKSNSAPFPRISKEEREEMHKYSKDLDKRFGEILREKFRKQGLKVP